MSTASDTEYVVIGLGRFGSSVARELAATSPVLGLDIREERVGELALDLENVVAADATDEATLRDLQVDRIGCAIVAIGNESMEASILATALLRQLGLPRIIARSLDRLHARVLLSVGAHEVINPEEEIGRRLARGLAHPNILERLNLAGNVVVAELQVPPQFVGRTAVNLRLRERHGITVVAVRREGEAQLLGEGDEAFRNDDVLIIVGSRDAVDALASSTRR